MEAAAAAQRRLRAGALLGARARHPSSADGSVRRPQLQHGRARPAWNGQVASLPADLAVLPPDLGREGDRRADVREQRDRPTRARRAVRRRLLRRGVGRLVRPEGRRQHHEGLHGVRRVLARAREHPRRRQPRLRRELQRRRRAPAADRAPLRAAATGDASRHGVHGPDPRLRPGLGRAEAESRALHGPLRPRQRLHLRVLEPASVAHAAVAGARPSCCSGPP